MNAHVSDSPLDQVILQISSAGEPVRHLTMDRGEFLLGRAAFCEVWLNEPGVPLVHSELHRQGDVLWIEAADDATSLVINGQHVRRLALRHGDRLEVGPYEITFVLKDEVTELPGRQVTDADLAQLSADELCDRILAEQEHLDAYEQGQLGGWKSLLLAVEATLADLECSGRRQELGIDDLATAVLADLQQLSMELHDVTDAPAVDLVAELNEDAVEHSRVTLKLNAPAEHFDGSDRRAIA